MDDKDNPITLVSGEGLNIRPPDPPGDICFHLEGRVVTRFKIVDGKFHVEIPQDMPRTEAAEQFIEVVRYLFQRYGVHTCTGDHQ